MISLALTEHLERLSKVRLTRYTSLRILAMDVELVAANRERGVSSPRLASITALPPQSLFLRHGLPLGTATGGY